MKLASIRKTDRNLSRALLKFIRDFLLRPTYIPNTFTIILISEYLAELRSIQTHLDIGCFSVGVGSLWAPVLSSDMNICYPAQISSLLYVILPLYEKTFMQEQRQLPCVQEVTNKYLFSFLFLFLSPSKILTFLEF